jgi:hypothetical protein
MNEKLDKILKNSALERAPENFTDSVMNRVYHDKFRTNAKKEKSSFPLVIYSAILLMTLALTFIYSGNSNSTVSNFELMNQFEQIITPGMAETAFLIVIGVVISIWAFRLIDFVVGRILR